MAQNELLIYRKKRGVENLDLILKRVMKNLKKKVVLCIIDNIF